MWEAFEVLALFKETHCTSPACINIVGTYCNVIACLIQLFVIIEEKFHSTWTYCITICWYLGGCFVIETNGPSAIQFVQYTVFSFVTWTAFKVIQ